METIQLEAELRERLSHGKLNALRKSGWLPAVIYGGEKSRGKSASTLLKVNEKTLLKLIGAHQRSNVIIDLKWGTENSNVVIKEIQRDVVSRKLIHVDFQKISMTEKIEVMVPVRVSGEAPGVKLSGGILEQITRELKVLCLPKDIPSQVTVDVSKLEIGQGIHLKDLGEIPGVQILSDPGAIIVNVVVPTAIEEAPAAEVAPAAGEPEVIKKGKKPGEEDEAAAGTPGAKADEKAPAGASKAGAPKAGAPSPSGK